MLPRFYSVRFTPLGPSGHHVLAKLILVLALANALYLAYHFEPVWRLKALEEQSYQRTLKHTSARVRYLHGDFRRGTKLPPVGEMFTPIVGTGSLVPASLQDRAFEADPEGRNLCTAAHASLCATRIALNRHVTLGTGLGHREDPHCAFH